MTAQIDSHSDEFTTFPGEQSCLDHLRELRWRHGEFCPYCSDSRVYHFSDRKTFKCRACRRRFSIKVGTIFEDTKLPLRKWFMAIWLITNHPKGIASTALAKDLEITQKTAWFVLHRLRHAAQTRSFNAPLRDDVGPDSTFVGCKKKDKHAKDRKGGTGKAIGSDMIERDGGLRVVHVSGHKAKTVQGKVRVNMRPDSAILTDEDTSFIGLSPDYNHLLVNHSKGEYIRLDGFVHTNGIENVWAFLKSQIVGIHSWVSLQHLLRYVDEMTLRFNRRYMQVGSRINDISGCVEGHMTYKELIA